MGVKRITRLLILLAVLALAMTGGALAESAVRLEAQTGYDGLMAYMKEMPVRVTLTNDGADTEGTLRVKVFRGTDQFDLYETPVSLAAGAVKDVIVYVTPITLQKEYEIFFEPDSGEAAAVTVSPTQSLSPSTALIGALSDTPSALSYLNITEAADPLMRSEYFQIVPLTPDTFPRTTSALNAFSMLVIDGVDARALDEQCLKALDQWLNTGGVVLVGGGTQAAAGYPLFESQYTGIKAGALTEGENVEAALLGYVMSARATSGGIMPVNETTGGDAALISGASGTPLVYMTPVNMGRVFTCAFSLSDKPLSASSTMRGLWQSVMLQSMPKLYASMLSRNTDDQEYIGTYSLSNMPVENNGSLIPALIICILFILMASFGSYFLLKKFDKRELMWAIVPALAVVAALSMMLVGNGMEMNKPIVVSITQINQDETGMVTANAMLGATSRDPGEMLLSVPGSLSMRPSDGAYYSGYSEDGEPPVRVFKYRYVQGDKPAVGYRPSAPWTVNYALARLQPPEGHIELSVWKEKDGLHGTVANHMGVPLPEGYLFTTDGYCRVPAIAPGAEVECAILQDPKPDGFIHDGLMLPTSGVKTNSDDVNMYSIISAAFYPESQVPDYKGRDYEDPREQTISSINQSISKGVEYGNNPGIHYVAITEDVLELTASINGQPVTRLAQSTLVDVKANYSAISPTGYVYYARGMLLPNEASAMDIPINTNTAAGTYYPVAEAPCFCFVIPDVDKIKIDALNLYSKYYFQGKLNMMLYNTRTNEWETYEDKKALTLGAEATDYINEKGELFLRYKPGEGVESYADVQRPHISIEGSVR